MTLTVKDEDNKWFDLLFSISNDGLALIDNKGNILKYNENLVITLSLNEKKIKHNIYDYVNDFSLKSLDAIYDISNNKKVRIKIKEVRDNEDFLYVVCITEISKDVMLKRMYESVIYTLTDGIHAVDTKGIVRIYNDAYGKLEGYSSNEVLGKYLEDVYKLDDGSSLLIQAQKYKKNITNKRQIYYTKKGNKIDVVTSAFPLYYNNKLIGSAAVVSDFTQMQKLIDRNIEIEKQLAEKLKKGDINSSPYYKFNDIVTSNKDLLDIISFAKLAAVNDSNVMIYGETGTGKELFAQSIHTASHRNNKPFMAINCAAIPETLLESLLFGTTKGAFTGAIDKAGLFEQADGGTLFLDEINSMPMLLQSKLLRILETKMVTRLGDTKSIPVDVRIVSSFNENPIEAVEKGIFRNDLFFRLGVVYLSIPPLRNRIEDIDLLYSYFIKLYNEKLNKNIIDLTEEVKDLFRKFEWPGNVRQLKNAIESTMNIIGDDNEYIELKHVPKHIIIIDNKMSENKMNISYNNNLNYYNLNNHNKQNNNYNNQNNNNAFDNKDNELNIFDKLKLDEYNLIIKYINQTNGNIAQAAKLMGISRQKLHYKIKKFNIK